MIKGPKNAVPTLKGWVSAKGELLKSQRITQDEIDEWNGVVAPTPEPEPEIVEDEVIEEVEVVEEAPKPKKRGLFNRLRNAN